MSLYLVATPIGHPKDISHRALEILNQCETIIGEEFKEVSKLLKANQITGKKLEQLNEHSKPDDVQALALLCQNQEVALVTDCGTPGFCDPGAHLVAACRQKKIKVTTILGASSLMGLLSMSSVRLDQFVFRGFLPAENESRKRAIEELKKDSRAVVLMDTPYRLQKLIDEMKTHFSDRKALLAINISQEDEEYLEGSFEQIKKDLKHQKAEFMILIYPKK